jgi:hypothetical protein
VSRLLLFGALLSVLGSAAAGVLSDWRNVRLGLGLIGVAVALWTLSFLAFLAETAAR